MSKIVIEMTDEGTAKVRVNNVKIYDSDIEDPVIGYFDRHGRVLCEKCLGPNTAPNTLWDGVRPIRIYRSNVWPYSQYCHKCRTYVLHGPGENECVLFDPAPNKVFILGTLVENRYSDMLTEFDDEQEAKALSYRYLRIDAINKELAIEEYKRRVAGVKR